MFQLSDRRRITRSLSSELQARLSKEPDAQSGGELAEEGSRSDVAAAQSGGVAGGGGTATAAMEAIMPCFQRSSSEEIFLGSLMESAMAPHVTEGMSFLGPPQPPRVNSEELFHNWLNNTDPPGLPPLSGDYRMPQTSKRALNETATINGQGVGSQPFQIPDVIARQTFGSHPNSNVWENPNSKHRSHAPNKEFRFQDSASWQMINWFQQSQPMTRSRSTELRRKYLAMQEGKKSPPSADALQWFALQGTDELNRAVASLGAFTRALASKRSDLPSSTSPLLSQAPMSQASLSSPKKNGDSLSAVVNMLKGSLERKKVAAMQLHVENPVSTSHWRALGQDRESPVNPMHGPCEHICPTLEPQQRQRNQNEAFTARMHIASEQFQAGLVTPHSFSPSDSSGNAPAMSTGAANSEGPSNSNPAVSPQNNFIAGSGQGNWPMDEAFQQNNVPSPTSNGTSNGEFPYEVVTNTDFQKRKSYLARASSLTSSCRSDQSMQVSAADRTLKAEGSTADAEDSTKKRRVERKRMMTEAKGRNYVPTMPSDLQAATKRCDALEKEVRSLKLNLSFMNRKDSEQTKRIEDLEKQNEELLTEKNRLLDELRRFIAGNNFA